MRINRLLVSFFIVLMALTKISAQEENPVLTYEVPSQNLLRFNRFLINPTFSTVREDKSYINLLHRNQSVQFDDNLQNYFLSYSGRISDRTGLGLSLYSQRVGPIDNVGVLANYAYGVKLSDKSNFTFGANVAYYNSGLNRNRTSTVEDDPFLNGFQNESLLSFQPGFNISFGQFDIGAFAENLFDYNLKTNSSITEFNEKTFSGHLQYTHEFENGDGLFENGRLMPLARTRLVDGEDLTFGGSLILDLPRIGWLQGGYDSFYGASAGIGFNLNRRLSLGYTMEKGLTTDFDNLGLTHEISFAYSFTPNLTEDRVMLEDNGNELVENFDPQTENAVASNDEIDELKRKLAENDAIIEELMFRQDSLEANRQKDLERRFEMVMRMVRNETKGERPDLEKRAEELFLTGRDKPTSLAQNTGNGQNIPNSTNTRETQQAIASTTLNNPSKKDALATRAAQDKPLTDRTSKTQTKSSAVGSKEPVKSRKFNNLDGVSDGYYVVANVYKGTAYMEKFMDRLQKQGLEPDYIDNPNNGLKYVFLKRYDTWDQAVAAYESSLNGNYDQAMWIMNVDNRYSNEAYAENVNKIKEKSSRYGTDVLQKNVVVRDNLAANETSPKTLRSKGIGAGYYLIANVFANPKNANRFVKLLNSYGLSASYFINPENNWRYVYLKRHESWNNALISYYSKLNDAYDDKMWIMRVTPNLIT
ncbi:type IX secretion system membrane protein PorP/SprF [Ulvibacterium sp.]|uniref:PorP/SprF family type IX secretion system membrane protein n=1 Tax=Ulvibacterium sp. TaxID=2665914 RepID=UPI0026261C07|nr:PorP/SprF family type IX secretion system membrane protein [Ulvibacterium sp.]